jgi:hypothetical protein
MVFLTVSGGRSRCSTRLSDPLWIHAHSLPRRRLPHDNKLVHVPAEPFSVLLDAPSNVRQGTGDNDCHGCRTIQHAVSKHLLSWCFGLAHRNKLGTPYGCGWRGTARWQPAFGIRSSHEPAAAKAAPLATTKGAATGGARAPTPAPRRGRCDKSTRQHRQKKQHWQTKLGVANFKGRS